MLMRLVSRLCVVILALNFLHTSRMRLVSVRPSHLPEKKYDAVFETDGREKTVPFGARGMSDYTKHKDPERKKRYMARHSATENWNKPDSAGALSYHLLWGPSTSLQSNIETFKRKFHLR